MNFAYYAKPIIVYLLLLYIKMHLFPSRARARARAQHLLIYTHTFRFLLVNAAISKFLRTKYIYQNNIR